MSVDRINKLKKVLTVMESREQQCLQTLMSSQRRLDEAKRNLDSLGDFQSRYSSKFQQAGGQGLRTSQFGEYRAFLEKICVAIGEQHRTVESADNEVQRVQAVWLAARQKCDGIRQLMESLRHQMVKDENRRDQKEMDDRSSRGVGRGSVGL
ncbi:MAG: hypothetical protein RIQ52_1189 [Pseudomonadota bacterium]|jgi:flagellar FliJ protein